MAIKGFEINGTVYKYDHNELENKPEALPQVTSSDAGKILMVDSSEKWVAATLPQAESSTF